MATQQQQQQHDDDWFAQVIVYGAGFVAVLIALPVILVACLGYLAIERGWRRWPIFLVGLLATGIVVLLGGHEAYGNTWYSVWAYFRHDEPFDARELWALAPLALSGGVLAAPVTHLVVLHRNEEVATRHRREVSIKARKAVQVRRGVERRRFPEPPDRTVLGLPLAGHLPEFSARIGLRSYVAPQVEAWLQQAVILGSTGWGKTVTALTIATEAARCGWPVYWIDGKADPDARYDFITTMRARGFPVHDGTTRAIDGWRGGPEAVVNRLLSTQTFTEPHYEGIARTVLRLAVGQAPPRSFAELVGRLDRRELLRSYRDDPHAARSLDGISDRDFSGVRSRYEGIAWAVGENLDGRLSYEDVDAAYVPVGRPENRHQAQEVGAFLLEDLLHWAMARKGHRPALVVVDEFSKLSSRPLAAVELVERARSFGVAVVLIGQTWASLGDDPGIRERLAGTVGTVIAHQLPEPREVAALAGTEWALERTEQTLLQGNTGLGSQREGNRYVVHPDEVRRLGRGEAFVIRGGHALKMRVRRVARG